MPKVLITGATGLLGRAFVKSFRSAGWDVVATGLSRANSAGLVRLDLLDESAVRTLIEKDRPNLIVHSAAERSPDAVAADPVRATALNVTASSHLSTLATGLRIPLLYISTDYVFPGVPGEAPYGEGATPRPTNKYGELKLAGEQAALEASSSSGLAAVLRLPVLYGSVDPAVGNGESAVNVLLDKVRDAAAGKQVVMDDWAQRFPTCVDDIAAATAGLGRAWLAILADSQTQAGSFPKILHFSAKERYTKYDMCEIMASILGLDISAMQRDKQGGGGGGGVQRPYDTQLQTGELEGVLGHKLECTPFKDWWQKELKA